MPTLLSSPSASSDSIQPRHARIRGSHPRDPRPEMRVSLVAGILLAFLAVMLLGLAGCGAGGYPGGGIEALSTGAVTIDAGQSYPIKASAEGNSVVSWTETCGTAPACGGLSSNTGDSIIFVAPAGLTAPITTTLTAVVAGTSSSRNVVITINPDPTLSNPPNTAEVGTPYTGDTHPTPGTSPLTLSISAGTLPAGLTLNTTTGLISGTPTATGTFTFTVQLVDSSAVPFTVSEQETIIVESAGAAPVMLSGNPPAGALGTPYSTAFTATGGTTPYTFSQISGSLPPGLTLSPGGILSGTPTMVGVSVFTVQVEDSVGTKVSASFSVTITNPPPTLTLTGPPAGTVGVVYSGSIGVTGGSSPYTCAIAGTLPAGLTSNNCAISGTPTTAGTASLTVTATDSSNPQGKIVGPVSLVINPAPLSLTLSSLPDGTINVPYSQTIGVAGGTAPYSCSITSGTLQAGLTLTGCTVSGTPTVASTVHLTVKATDSSTTQETTTGPVSLTINPAPLTMTLTSLPDGTINVPYNQTIGVSGGTAPYSCTITAGTLQAGLTLTGCTVSGTPTVASTVHLTVKATDSSPTQETTTGPVSLTINPAPLTLTLISLPDGTINVPYSQTIGVSGGTAPYNCTITSGALQTGLTLTGCTVSGTPTVASTVHLTVKATDSSPTQETTSGPVSLTINPAPVSIVITSPPAGTVNVPYSGPIGITGGTGPYTCSITVGTLPAGLTLSGCTIVGTPTTPGSTPVTVKVIDSGNPKNTGSGPITIVINPAPLTLTLTSLPDGTINVPYSHTIGVSGGTAPYNCTITSGTLQAGLTLTGCTVSGTPTVASTVHLTVKATDSSPTQETTSGPVSLTINPAPLTLTLTSLPDGTINVPYNQTIGVSGGTAPYNCTITSGTLQAGLTLTGCTVSGTPTVASTVHLTVKATDSSPTQETTSGPVSLTINPAPLTLTLTSLPDGTVGIPYSQTIGVSGGTAPYNCTITSGTLQAGLTLTGCTVSGTPTVASTVHLQVKATDSSPTQETTTGPVSLTINPAALALTLTSLPDGTINVPYSAVIGVSGGTGPYNCTITSGALQTGLTLTGCTVSGTPTVASTVHLMVKATDSSNPQESTTGPVSLTINPAALTLTLSTLPDGTVGVPYSQTIGVSGGTAPYNCTITSGALQTGLTLTGCTVSGTPTVASTVHLTVKATDSSPTQETTSGPVSLTINPAPVSIVITSPPAGTVNVPYSGPIGITGGTGPYTCAITSGTLPSTLSLSGCTIVGTPTSPSTTTVTVKVTDSSNPKNTSSGPITVVINPATATLTLSSPPPATVDTPYTGVIGVSGGTGPYMCHLNSGTVPPGLTLTNCTFTGTPTTVGATVLNITATDSATGTTTGNITVTVNPLAPLTLNGSLPNATLGVPYTQTITAQGGLPPYKYSITAGTLPPGITLDPNTGVFSGTPTAVGASSFTLTATDSEGPAQTANLPLVLLVVYPTTTTDSELDGPYTYLFQGYDDVVLGVLAYQTATVASFTADGTGVVSAGELDANHQSSDPAGNTVSSQNFLGTYTLDTHSRGSLTITVLNPDGTTGHTTTYALSVKAPVAPATVTTEGSLIESDDDQVVGTKGSGSLFLQTPAAFPAGLNGSYAFGVSGDTPCLPSCTIGIIAGPVATVGQFTTDSAGAITSGTSDTNIASTNIPNSDLGGTYTAADDNGRLQLSLSTGGTEGDAYPTDYAVYLIDANRAFILSTDKHSAYILLAGSAQLQTQTTFTDASMSAPFIGYENAQTDPGLVGAVLENVLNFSTATIFRGTGVTNHLDKCNITNVDTGGLTGLLNGLTGILGNLTGLTSILGGADYTGETSCQTTSNGRGVLQYPSGGLLGLLFPPPSPRVYYLSSPETGYFLETSYAGLGKFEAQTGAPFSEANTFTGTYVYGSAPASSLASIDGSGYIVSNGHGSATTTLDTNIGVGTVNLIELGQTSTQPYTAPDATTGRFTLGPAGTDVIYAITPNRFVLLDTDPLVTSPSVAVLY